MFSLLSHRRDRDGKAYPSVFQRGSEDAPEGGVGAPAWSLIGISGRRRLREAEHADGGALGRISEGRVERGERSLALIH